MHHNCNPMTLVQVVKSTWNGGSPSAEFNNAAQAWNHEFFWSSMKPGGGGTSLFHYAAHRSQITSHCYLGHCHFMQNQSVYKCCACNQHFHNHIECSMSCLLITDLIAGEPSGELKFAIEKDFGSFDEFKKQFSTAGATQFGSGWAWLVSDGGKLKVSFLLHLYKAAFVDC